MIKSSTLEVLESRLGYSFANKSLLQKALIHSSFSGPTDSYERLEFLGDRVLGLLLAHYFYEKYPENDEGELSLRLHNEAQKLTLANVARKLHLYDFLKTQTGINFVQNDNIMADVVESLLGAIFLDGGLDEANKFLLNFWPLSNDRVDARKKDAKTLLQEWCLKNGLGLPVYKMLSKSGPDHDPEMVYEVKVTNLGSERAVGGNRKTAEQKAAAALFERLHERETN